MTAAAAMETIARDMLEHGTYELTFRRAGSEVQVKVNPGARGTVSIVEAARDCGMSRQTFYNKFLDPRRPKIRRYLGKIRRVDVERIRNGEIN